MRVDFDRACAAAAAGAEALITEIGRRDKPDHPAGMNDVVLATAVLVLGIVETAGLDVPAFQSVLEATHQRREAGRAP